MTVVRNLVRRNFHRDSVRLLHLSEEAKRIEGVRDAAVVMGTTTNKELLSKLGLLADDGFGASESDMILAVVADSQQQANMGLRQIEEMILKPQLAKGQNFYSLEAALKAVPDANLAVVSIPGEYAKDIVLKGLDKGLNIHLFSDHVPPEHEREMKEYAKRKGLLVMGPAAGTSIINGKAIAFANVVKRGTVGIVAAAGTGLQEVSVLLSQAGLGVSAGLGTGGGDVRTEIGGLMTIQSIDALEQDPETETIVVISKPPDIDVRHQILNHITEKTTKRYVTCFLGPESYDIPPKARNRVLGTKTLQAAFLETIGSAEPNRRAKMEEPFQMSSSELMAFADKAASGLSDGQKYVRGLYTGGTLAYETLIILSRMIGEIYSNAPLDPKLKLVDSYKSVKDSVVDLGEEEFTVGRAHPMIDPTIRKMRLLEEARDREVAVIIMDIMLGYGSHPDPAGAMLGAIGEAREIAERDGRALPILVHVCGTEQDPQPLSEQTIKLQNAGVHVLPTNALMAIAGALTAKRGKISTANLEDVSTNLLRRF
jgi:succinyl-CoA synthetase alpha subunit